MWNVILWEKGPRYDRGEVFSAEETVVLRSIEQVEIPLLEVFEGKRINHE
jgi:hypothetical protein